MHIKIPVKRKEPTMKWIKKTFKTWLLFLVPLTGLVLAGCEGTDSREKVDDTVKEFTGQKSLERMDQMKKDIDDINKKQADRLKEIE
jgi:outer membrane murein-binding lipoprotein Lpp